MITEKTLSSIKKMLSVLGHNDVEVSTSHLDILNTPVVSFTLKGIPKSFEDSFNQSLHHLLREVIAKEINTPVHEVNIIIDINNKLHTRVKEIQTMAAVLASRAAAFNAPIHCDPMPPLERKILHTILQNNQNLVTESFGIGDDRHIVITVKQ